MKKLMIAGVLLVAAWTAYWFIAKGAILSGATEKISELRAQGYAVSHNDLAVSGFPLRFNIEAGPLAVQTPDDQSRAAARMDIADISAPAWRPTRWRVTHIGPGAFDLPAGTGRWVFDTVTQAATIDAGARVTGGLSSLAIDAQSIVITATGADAPPAKSVDTLLYRFNREGSGAVYSVTTTGVILDGTRLGKLGSALGDTVTSISGTMDVSEYSQVNASYRSDDFFVLWGPADLGGNFALARSDTGLSGNIGLNIANEQTLIKALVDKGLLGGGEAMMAGILIGGLPKTPDGRRQVTLTVRDNIAYLGPIKLGPLPF